jgi:hypothetical protein
LSACPFEGSLVTTETVGQESCDSTDGRDTDPCAAMYLAIRQSLLKEFDNVPAVYERL